MMDDHLGNDVSDMSDDSFDEEEYDKLNDATFGMALTDMSTKGFNFANAYEKYKTQFGNNAEDAINSDIITPTSGINNDNFIYDGEQEELLILKNLSLKNKNDTNTSDDEITTCRTSIVDQFYLWIIPQQIYMLSDLHNMNCRKKKLFNYNHIIPTLEDKMLNRIRIKFQSSKYLFGVDIATIFQLFQRKLSEATTLIPFNSDYYYWEYYNRKHPNVHCLNRMLIADDMWLPPITTSLSEVDKKASVIRPLLIKYENSLGCLSFSSAHFPRKILSCDNNNSDNINKIHNPELFSGIQKRYYVLSLIDKAVSLAIDFEIKLNVLSYQIQSNLKPDNDPQMIAKYQNSLGDFMIKLIPLYPFILNYDNGIKMFPRIFNLLSNHHNSKISNGIYDALFSDKLQFDRYAVIFDDDTFTTVIVYGLGDVRQLDNHVKIFQYFYNNFNTKFYESILFWRLIEMILSWLVPFCFSNGIYPSVQYLLCFFNNFIDAVNYIDLHSNKSTLKSTQYNSICEIQNKILSCMKALSFRSNNLDYDKKIIYIINSILQKYSLK